jgi:hypothetical protein
MKVKLYISLSNSVSVKTDTPTENDIASGNVYLNANVSNETQLYCCDYQDKTEKLIEEVRLTLKSKGFDVDEIYAL